jgi:hypothetical protein
LQDEQSTPEQHIETNKGSTSARHVLFVHLRWGSEFPHQYGSFAS